jgi:hypothetical protein
MICAPSCAISFNRRSLVIDLRGPAEDCKSVMGRTWGLAGRLGTQFPLALWYRLRFGGQKAGVDVGSLLAVVGTAA